ncbi:hypothetical protein ETW23_03970 [Leisingera sp. NJS201]|uniref:hypothetical protein n=1 Tax=Leisingera sp. NJS201 TaxID=2508306 RepID=UPI001070DEDB|nr:hypothetical protein [Leisingera sp. NJS201]QBR35423.1 hypothetical protein ETW23_03970 [Leisingera sp. NJS201]
MDKNEFGCPIKWAPMFGYDCLACGASDYAGGKDTCASRAESAERQVEAARLAGWQADQLTGSKADTVLCDEVEDARLGLAAALDGLMAALVKQHFDGALRVGLDLASGPDRTVHVEITRRDDAEPEFAACRHAAPAAFDTAAPEPVLEVPVDAPRVIGLCGLAGSGKTTAAEFLEGLGYTRIAFADPLKAMLRALMASAGVPEGYAERMLAGDLKEAEIINLGGRSPRYAMQTLGTEWGRKLMHPDFWVQIAARRAVDILDAGGRVVFDDVRMANEAAAARQLGGGQVWQVKGRAVMIAKDGEFHESERLEVEPDLVLDNSGCLERLEAQVLEHILG